MNNPLPRTLFCFSHLRWDFVYQRPQHLMSRFARNGNVYYVEEPVFYPGIDSSFSVTKKMDGLSVCVPHLPSGLSEEEVATEVNGLLKGLLKELDIPDYFFWYYTPMALKYTQGFTPVYTVYDCMDELSAFKFAPRELKELEQQLFDQSSIVFTGGYSLYEAKRMEHNNIHSFPSSIDKQHFMQAREVCEVPADQVDIKGFKIGFYGVLDERFDTSLIAEIAEQRPEWQIMLIGPVVKIHPASLPEKDNIHYLGPKSYDQLPLYLSGWDVALIPFLLNESTFYISPTKTPEYLAGGKRVVSTAIRDVVSFYGKKGLVGIGIDAQDFISIIDGYASKGTDTEWLQNIDDLLSHNSWEHTFTQMRDLLAASIPAAKVLVFPNELVDENNY